MARAELEAVIAELGLSVDAEFVPWSRSRSFDPKIAEKKHVNGRALNWRVTLKRGDRAVLTTDYSAGIAHCPAYKRLFKGRWTIDVVDAVIHETEHGKEARGSEMSVGTTGAAILPDPVDVIWSLASESDVLDYPTYEEWADCFGLDPDSRKGEASYRSCIEIALKLRAAISEDGLKKLREASTNY